jgi:Domain of unknown function (DUF5615)
MASLYADEDFPLPVVVDLRNLGHDVLTAHEAGQANQDTSRRKFIVASLFVPKILIFQHKPEKFIRPY